MSIANYLPHRLLINKNLREEVEREKVYLKKYTDDYDAKINDIEKKIESQTLSMNKLIQKKKEFFENLLAKEESELAVIKDSIYQFAEIQYKIQLETEIKTLTTQKRNLNICSKKILKDYIQSIKEEIEVLKKRIDKLNELYLTDKIINLIRISIENINITHSSEAILNTINSRLNSSDTDDFEQRSLLKLRTLINEQVEIECLCKYIKWQIAQKKSVINDLYNKINQISSLIDECTLEIKDIEKNIENLRTSQINYAQKIRFYWSKPISFLNAKIDDLNYSRKQCIKKQKENSDTIRKMKGDSYYDKYDWDSVISKKNDLRYEFESISSGIKETKNQREKFYKRKERIIAMFSNNDICTDLLTGDSIEDEIYILIKRCLELEKLIKDKEKEANSEYISQKTLLTTTLSELNTKINELRCQREQKIKQKEEIEKNDSRLEIIKLFIKNDKINSIDMEILELDRKIDEIQRTIDSTVTHLNYLKPKELAYEAKEELASLSRRLKKLKKARSKK